MFEAQADAFYTSGLLLDDGVIDPRDTRAVLAFCLDICAEAARAVAADAVRRGADVNQECIADSIRKSMRRISDGLLGSRPRMNACTETNMQFTHEHLEIQKTLKRFIDEEINPHVDEWEAAEIFPAHEVFKRLGELGLLGLTKPEEYGGAGLDYSYAMAMAEALGHTALRRRADGDRRADRHGDAGAGALRQRRVAPRVPRAGDRRRHGGLHRRAASPAPAATWPRIKSRRA